MQKEPIPAHTAKALEEARQNIRHARLALLATEKAIFKALDAGDEDDLLEAIGDATEAAARAKAQVGWLHDKLDR